MRLFRLFLLVLLPLFTFAQTDVEVVNISASPFAPYAYGNVINFQITIRNNGPLAVQNIVLSDAVPCGLQYAGGSQAWILSGQNRVTTMAGILNSGQSNTVSIDFVVSPCTLAGAWNNVVSVTSYQDISGNNIFASDTNTLNNAGSSELPVFDLALRKTLATPPPYNYGDVLTFNIDVVNQGNQPVSGFMVNDYLPAGVGFIFDPLLNPMWSGGPNTYSRWVTVNPTLAPGATETVTIKLKLIRTTGGARAWLNYAEIASASDINGNPFFDADSFYGSNSIQENDVLPGSPNDNNLNSTGLGAGDDDDDHDPAGTPVFDLALTKTQGSALLSFSYLQDVEYVFTIYNQGSVPATNIEITDYLSPALQYTASAKNILRGWNYDNITHTAKRVYNQVLMPGQSDTLKLDLMPIQFYTDPFNAWTDFAEISDADDTDPNTSVKPLDMDSAPDSINGNDAGGRPNSPSDDAIDGDASGQPGDGVASTDEDDHDTHKIQIFDLALRKIKVTPGAFFQIGDNVTFEITVFNQGNVPAKNIVVSDYVPSGFDFISGGPNAGWVGAAPLVKYTIQPVLNPGTNTSIQITLKVKSSSLPGAYLNYAEVSAAMDTLNNNRNDDADSVLDDNPSNDNLALPGSADDDNIFGNSFFGGDQDDHDVAGIELLCQRPTLTVGIPECDPGNGTYSVTYYSNVANIISNAGTVAGSKITGIAIGTNITITASNGAGCTQNLTVVSPAGCPGTGGCTYPKLTVGQPWCGSNGWSVSFSTDLGSVSSTVGTITGNTIIDIPFNQNITVTSTNGNCISSVEVNAPTNCGIPCANSPITISGPICETNGAGTYKVNFIADAASTVSASAGVMSAGMVTGIPSGTNLILTITTPGCDTRIVVVPAGDCPVCQRPTLTVGIPECDPGNGTYSVTYYSNVANIVSNAGTVAGSKITGIAIGTNISITASNGAGCTQNLTVVSPAGCPGTGGCTYPKLTVGQPLCGSNGWSVSFSTDLGSVSSTAGTITGNTIINIPFNQNITVTSTNGNCISSVEVNAPTNCGIPCANSPITISGPICETNGAGTYKVNFIADAASNVSASTGVMSAGMVTGIPSGTNLILTITTPGCDTRIVVVPAGDCPVCQRPTLTVGIPECDPGNGTYSVTYYSNVVNITSNAGTVAGSKITGIAIGTNITITASNGAGCTQSLTVVSPAGCPGTGGCTYPKLTVGQPWCGSNGWSVSFSTDLGSVNSTAGTITGNTIINIPFNQNITVTSTNGNCISSVQVNAPTNCGIPCANSPITISGPICETNGTGTYRVNFIVDAGSNVSASAGVMSAGMVTGIPSGTNLILTITTPGCDTRIVVVPAATCSLGNSSVGSFVWQDNNGDGQQNPGEPGIPGVQVILYNEIGVIVGQTNTTANGQYIFNNVTPGNYYIKFIPPAGFTSTFPNIGNDDADSDIDNFMGQGTTSLFTLIPGQNDATIDAGYYRCIPIGERVWYDINRNDIWNTNENGINGIRVNLWRNHFGTWIVWDMVYTSVKPGSPSDDGYFNFCAPPGDYFVEVIMPPLGLVRARPNIGSKRDIDSDINSDGKTNIFRVVSGQRKTDIGAGFYPMAVAGNLVWRDDNLNGVQEASEARVPGVTVQAVEIATGRVAATVVTDQDGIYQLEYLEKQDYFLRFFPPAGFVVTIPRAGNDDLDSDVDHSFGPFTTRSLSMQPSVQNNNIDMGIAYGVLPVDWLDVSALPTPSGNMVYWKVANEWNVSHYIVERKIENQSEFTALPQAIPSQKGGGKVLEYAITDTESEKNIKIYYRIKQVDFDGKVSYSKMVSVLDEEDNGTNINIYPNPAKGWTNIEINHVDNNSLISMEIMDAQGKLVNMITKDLKLEAGKQLIPVSLDGLAEGVYYIKISNGNQVLTYSKMIVIK